MYKCQMGGVYKCSERGDNMGDPFKTVGGFSQRGQPPHAVYVIVTKFSQRGQPLVTMGEPHFLLVEYPLPTHLIYK